MNLLIRYTLLSNGIKLLKKHFKKPLVDVELLVDFYDLNRGDILRHINMWKRLDFIYIIFTSKKYSIREKRDYLMKTSLSDKMKNTIFERFTGDYGFKYCKQKSHSREFIL